MKIWYSNPYNIQKKIGEALNDFCRIVPNNEDWIILQDGDICYLTPDWGNLIHESLKLEGDNYGLIGCYTNRLRGVHQLNEMKISNNHDMKHHFNVAKEYSKRDAGINDIGIMGVAGLFMAFKKKTWIEVGGFNENSIAFDTDFNVKVRNKGYKLGLINNLYVYHSYRIWNDINPADDISHLN